MIEGLKDNNKSRPLESECLAFYEQYKNDLDITIHIEEGRAIFRVYHPASEKLSAFLIYRYNGYSQRKIDDIRKTIEIYTHDVISVMKECKKEHEIWNISECLTHRMR